MLPRLDVVVGNVVVSVVVVEVIVGRLVVGAARRPRLAACHVGRRLVVAIVEIVHRLGVDVAEHCLFAWVRRQP